eukprot:scaffold25006_cov79-Isochrysis_galbana.AAC.1
MDEALTKLASIRTVQVRGVWRRGGGEGEGASEPSRCPPHASISVPARYPDQYGVPGPKGSPRPARHRPPPPPDILRWCRVPAFGTGTLPHPLSFLTHRGMAALEPWAAEWGLPHPHPPLPCMHAGRACRPGCVGRAATQRGPPAHAAAQPGREHGALLHAIHLGSAAHDRVPHSREGGAAARPGWQGRVRMGRGLGGLSIARPGGKGGSRP